MKTVFLAFLFLVCVAVVTVFGAEDSTCSCSCKPEIKVVRGKGKDRHKKDDDDDDHDNDDHDLPDHHVSHTLTNPFFCAICKELIGALPAVVNQGTVNAAFNLICDRIPISFMKRTCRSAASKFSGTVASLINEGVARADICKRIKMC